MVSASRRREADCPAFNDDCPRPASDQDTLFLRALRADIRRLDAAFMPPATAQPMYCSHD